MTIYIKLTIESSSQCQCQSKRWGKARAVASPLPKVSRRQKRACKQSALLDRATVLYRSRKLPGCWEDELLSLPSNRAKQVLSRMEKYRERYRDLQISKFRQAMRQAIWAASAKQLSLFD